VFCFPFEKATYVYTNGNDGKCKFLFAANRKQKTANFQLFAAEEMET
jgi:hypothetical protein